MFGWFKRKKKQNKTYKLSEFSRRRTYAGRTQVYHDASGEWLYWYMIASVVSDDSGCSVDETELYSSCVSDENISNNAASTSSLDSSTNYSSSSESYTPSSSNYDSSPSYSSGSDYGSSSSYDSSSSSSFD